MDLYPPRRPWQEPWTYALLAEAVQIVKIGRAQPDCFESRPEEIQAFCPVELFLIGKYPGNIEKKLHRLLRSERLHGEWFRYSAETIAVLAVHLAPVRISVLGRKRKRLAGKEPRWRERFEARAPGKRTLVVGKLAISRPVANR